MTSLGAPARRGGGLVVLVLGALVVINLYVFVWDKDTSVAAIKREAEAKPPAAALPSQPLVTPPPINPGGAAGSATAPVGPPGTVDGKVAKSDTLGRLLKKSGLSGPEADEVIRSLSGVLDFKTIRAGQSFHIERGPDGRVRLFELVISKVQKVRTERAATGELVGKADTSQTRVETKAIGGRIDSSLWNAIKSSGESAALVDFFVDVFAYDIDFFNDTHEGDTFRVVVEKEYAGTELLRYKRIIAAEYQGKAGTFRTYYFAPGGDEKRGGYFDPEGESSEKTLLKTPLKFTRISSGFDRKRMHPVLHTVRAHLGIDYSAPVGTPVWAAAPGTVIFRGFNNGGAGNLVSIKHDSGIETHYMHLSKFADIKVGQRVAAKTVIGYVGSTGLSTGPHLHFGVKQAGNWIDPTKLSPMRNGGVASRDLDAFRTEAARLEAQLSGIKIAEASAQGQ
ncbi:MAG TPA: M23 family metallopeptidase [Kofleriaceae bacterium]|nr:M23 family metallopeptidase [Kofleriaceae bacterium]